MMTIKTMMTTANTDEDDDDDKNNSHGDDKSNNTIGTQVAGILLYKTSKFRLR